MWKRAFTFDKVLKFVHRLNIMVVHTENIAHIFMYVKHKTEQEQTVKEPFICKDKSLQSSKN